MKARDFKQEYAYSTGKFLYVWGYAIVNTHNRRIMVTSAPEPGLYGGILMVAPVNRLAMLSDYMAVSQRFVVCPQPGCGIRPVLDGSSRR